jgi:hypothetical protein
LGIDPMSKVLVFSDNLDLGKAESFATGLPLHSTSFITIFSGFTCGISQVKRVPIPKLSFTREEKTRYQGLRHDSGDPLEWGEKAIAHYQKLGIDPMSKGNTQLIRIFRQPGGKRRALAAGQVWTDLLVGLEPCVISVLNSPPAIRGYAMTPGIRWSGARKQSPIIGGKRRALAAGQVWTDLLVGLEPFVRLGTHRG